MLSVECDIVNLHDAVNTAKKIEHSLAAAARTMSDGDSETFDLYRDAKEKLEELKLKLQAGLEPESSYFQASIQKVSDWQRSLPTPQHVTCPAAHCRATTPTSQQQLHSSCYGSLPPSPSSPADLHESNFNSINNNASKTEADSGCPGSDRSTLWLSYLQSKRISPSTRSNSKSKENISNSLYNVEEESPSPRLHPRSSVITPRDIVNMNNEYVKSITIEKSEAAPVATSTPNIHPHDDTDEEESQRQVPPTPVRSVKKMSTCKNLFPGVESQELAEQIDHEILELRNFFDDHREEMMYLLHTNKDPITLNTSLPFFQADNPHQRENKMFQSLTNIETRHFDESEISTPDLPDPRLFQFQDQIRVKNQSQQQMFQSLQDWRPGRDESESDVNIDPTLRIRKMEFMKRRRKKERQRRRFNIDEDETDQLPSKQNIHSFFPKFDNRVPSSPQRSQHVFEDSLGDNGIPMLNLSDLTSEVTAPDISIISEAFSAANDQDNRRCNDGLSRTSRSIACDTKDLRPTFKCPSSTQTTPGRPVTCHSALCRVTTPGRELNKSMPLLQHNSEVHLLDVPSQHSQVVIIKQSDCDHKKKSKDSKRRKKKQVNIIFISSNSATIAAYDHLDFYFETNLNVTGAETVDEITGLSCSDG